jgi:hypothetical protein
MRVNVDSALTTFLNNFVEGSVGGNFAVVDLFTISLVSGSVLRLASWDVDIAWKGNTFISAWPYVNRSKLKQAVGLEPAEMELSIFAPPEAEIGTSALLGAIAMGQFDGATVQVDRLYLDYTFAPIGAIYKWFLGTAGPVSELDRVHAVLVCKDKRELLNVDAPRNKFMPGCQNTLGDANCTVSLASYAVSATVQAGSNASIIQTNLNTATYPGPLPAPTVGPTLTEVIASTTGHNLYAPVTYYAVVTYTGPNGESIAGPETSIYINRSDAYITATFDPASPPNGATGWNLYVGTSSGGEVLQNNTGGPLVFGATWTENASGLYQGQPAPVIPDSGYFALGVVKFTSGANNGYSRFISRYGNDGSLTVIPPLPTPPANGDSISVVPGCPKTWTACANKFVGTPAPTSITPGNTANLKAFPFLPQPEQGL